VLGSHDAGAVVFLNIVKLPLVPICEGHRMACSMEDYIRAIHALSTAMKVKNNYTSM
jgi:hypothetical protein